MPGPGTTKRGQRLDDAAQLRLIADNVPAMMIAYDAQLRCLFANRRFAEFFGQTTAGIVGKHLRQIVGEAAYQEIKPHFDRVLAGERTTYRRIRTLDSGEQRALEVELIPHLDGDGGTQGLFAVTTDVTERERAHQQLLESEERFRSLTAMSSDFYWETDAEHRLSELPTGGAEDRVPALDPPLRIGERRWEIPSLSPDAAGWQAHRQTLDAHLPFRDFTFSRRGVDGSERHLWISGDPTIDAAGAFKGYRGVGADFTARKQAEQTVLHAADELRLFAEHVPALAASFDADLRCRFANKAYAEFFGMAAEDVIGLHVSKIAGEDVYSDLEGHFARALQGQAVNYQRTQKLPNGEMRHLEVKLVPRRDDAAARILGFFSVVSDVTEYKLAQERIQRVAHRDGLTGLANRLLFNDRLSHELSLAKRDSHPFALLYVDLDRFKAVNDTLGHGVGDELLQAVAARIREQVRESDTVARIGGDEFTLILSTISKCEDAGIVAQKIIAALATPMALASQTAGVQIGASIGIALYPGDGSDADALVNAADTAMYRAKQTGNAFCFAGLA